MTDLQALLEAVEAGTAQLSDFIANHYPHQDWVYAYSAYCGSLDAAKALHEAVLPGWFWENGNDLDGYWAEIRPPDQKRIFPALSLSCSARAWLITIIRALIAEERAND